MLEPTQEQAEVVVGSGADSIATVTIESFEVIASHPMLGLHVPNDGRNRSFLTIVPWSRHRVPQR